MPRKKLPKPAPPPIHPTYERRKTTFFPPPWSKKMDDTLFKQVSAAFSETGSGYGAITSFAAKNNLTLDATQGRWHKISKRV